MRKIRETSGERIVKDIKRKTRKQYSAEENIRIVLGSLRGEESVQNFTTEKVYRKAYTTNDPRTFWRPARNGLQVISHAKPIWLKSKDCALRRVSSKSMMLNSL